ncbi:MAG: NAD-dependent DNA ligase LigA [Bacteroidales bacterium]
MSAEKRIIELRKELHKHNHLYYIEASPIISDFEFDTLLKELEQLEKENPQFEDINSPTKRVGSDTNSEFEQGEHSAPMLSLSNTYNTNELREFDAKVAKLLDEDRYSYVCELKFDGSSISLTYEDGKLSRATTRGDGSKGDIVTHNVRTIHSIPLSLIAPYPSVFEARGEILMPISVFDKLNKNRTEQGEQAFANPRNAAAGTLKLQKSSIVAQRKLDAFIYGTVGSQHPSGSHYEKLQEASRMGFKVSEHTQRCDNIEDVIRYIDKADKLRHTLDYATDGVVIKVDLTAQQDILGFTSKSPRWAVAYKFKAEQALTTLNSVDFQVGRTGNITPVANLEAIQLAGTVVRRASLHNEDIINELDLYYGDSVFIEKGGEIIPKVVSVEKSKRPPNAQKVVFISNCPVCKTELKKDEGEAQHYCPNSNHCTPQLKGRIEHFISRKAMDIQGIGNELVNQLFEAGLIRNSLDLYSLKKNDVLKLERLAEKSSDNLIKGISESRKINFERLLYALGIRHVGETTAKDIARHFMSFAAISKASKEELLEVNGVGDKVARSVISFFSDKDNLDIVERVKSIGLTTEIVSQLPSTNKLSGKTIVISGTFENHSREEIKQLIEANGGKNGSSISKNTDYLLAGTGIGPSKISKAKELNTTIIKESEFELMIK